MFHLSYIKKCCGTATAGTNVIVGALDIETAPDTAVQVEDSGVTVQVGGSACAGYEADIVAEVTDHGIISN